MARTTKLTYFCISIMLVLAIVFLLVYIPNTTYAQGENFEYSDVLSDLQSDSDFDINDYPSKVNDYSLQVIQIAESVNGELFVYVYQPSNAIKDLIATSINISTAINDSLYYKNYKLKLLNSNGVFDKYLVQNFTLKGDVLRYYDISSIFRAFDSSIDKGLPDYNENEIEEVAFEVGKLYTATTLNGSVSYFCLDTETILVTDKYVGYIRYSNGFKLYVNKCDSWYVAFSTDKPIDRLIEADVYYVEQDYTWTMITSGVVPTIKESYGDKVEQYVSLKYTDVASNPADGLFSHKYSWNRIEKVSDFIKNEDLTDEAKQDLTNMQWILRFAETDYSMTSDTYSQLSESKIVSEVSILRLKFETNGEVYNLGVVDNKQTPPEDAPPDNNNTNEWDLPDFGNDALDLLGTVAMMIALIFMAMLIAPLLPYLIRLVIWIISLPFKLVGLIFKSLRK